MRRIEEKRVGDADDDERQEEQWQFLLQRVSLGAHVVVVELDDMLQRRRRRQINMTASSHPKSPELTKICSIGFSDNYMVASAEFHCV